MNFTPDPVVVDPQISVAIVRDRIGIDLLHLLRHDTDIERAIAALVAEAIELETVAESHQRNDVLLEADVGAPPAAAATTAAATTTSAATGNLAAAATAAKMRTAAAFERLR